MKYLILCLAPFVFSQLPPMDGGKITYQEVVSVDGASQDELFRRAENWVVDNYISAQDVINQADPENGRIVAKGYYKITFVLTGYRVYHALKIEVKEGRYRYTVTDFSVMSSDNQYTAPSRQPAEKTAKSLRKKVHKGAVPLIEDLKKAMGTEAEEW